MLPNTLDAAESLLRRWKVAHLSLMERATIIKHYIRPRLLYQLPYTKADANTINKLERQAQSTSREFNKTGTPHRILQPSTIPHRTEMEKSSILHQHKHWLTQSTTLAPRPSFSKAWSNTAQDFPTSKNHSSRQAFNKAIRSAAKKQRLPLTPRQQQWTSELGVDIKLFLIRAYKWKVRPAIISFSWKLVNGRVPLGQHFSPHQPCPLCGGEEDTTHLMTHVMSFDRTTLKPHLMPSQG